MNSWRAKLWFKIVALTIVGVFLFSEVSWAARTDVGLVLSSNLPQVPQPTSQPANENNLWKIFQEFVNSVIPSAYAQEIGSYGSVKVSNSILNDWRRATKAVIVENPIPEAVNDTVDTVNNELTVTTSDLLVEGGQTQVPDLGALRQIYEARQNGLDLWLEDSYLPPAELKTWEELVAWREGMLIDAGPTYQPVSGPIEMPTPETTPVNAPVDPTLLNQIKDTISKCPTGLSMGIFMDGPNGGSEGLVTRNADGSGTFLLYGVKGSFDKDGNITIEPNNNPTEPTWQSAGPEVFNPGAPVNAPVDPVVLNIINDAIGKCPAGQALDIIIDDINGGGGLLVIKNADGSGSFGYNFNGIQVKGSFDKDGNITIETNNNPTGPTSQPVSEPIKMPTPETPVIVLVDPAVLNQIKDTIGGNITIESNLNKQNIISAYGLDFLIPPLEGIVIPIAKLAAVLNNVVNNIKPQDNTQESIYGLIVKKDEIQTPGYSEMIKNIVQKIESLCSSCPPRAPPRKSSDHTAVSPITAPNLGSGSSFISEPANQTTNLNLDLNLIAITDTNQEGQTGINNNTNISITGPPVDYNCAVYALSSLLNISHEKAASLLAQYTQYNEQTLQMETSMEGLKAVTGLFGIEFSVNDLKNLKEDAIIHVTNHYVAYDAGKGLIIDNGKEISLEEFQKRYGLTDDMVVTALVSAQDAGLGTAVSIDNIWGAGWWDDVCDWVSDTWEEVTTGGDAVTETYNYDDYDSYYYDDYYVSYEPTAPVQESSSDDNDGWWNIDLGPIHVQIGGEGNLISGNIGPVGGGIGIDDWSLETNVDIGDFSLNTS
ncbi:MAG: hypothetical protein ABIH27_02480, partial [Candidatus Omnitrophota bacterium]